MHRQNQDSMCKGTEAAKGLECLKNSKKPVWLERENSVTIWRWEGSRGARSSWKLGGLLGGVDSVPCLRGSHLRVLGEETI